MATPTQHLATVAARGVRAPSPDSLPEAERGSPAVEPLYQTAVFGFSTIAQSERPLAGEGGYAYSRFGLPNARSFELGVAALEGAPEAVAVASGTAAVWATLASLCQAGDRVLVQRDAYGGTLALLPDLGRMGVEAALVDVHDAEAMRAALAGGARALLVESLSNPLLRAPDLPALVACCEDVGAALVVDNTFATPILTRPLEVGAAAVVHSATKALGGHHDLTLGVVAGDAALCRAVRSMACRLGFAASPFDAWLACRGLRTLALRVERSQASARVLAEHLRADERALAVHHPGWGSLVSFDLGSGEAAARAVSALAGSIPLVLSLGGAETTLSHPASSSHRNLSPADRATLGIGDGLLRLSVGLEDAADLWRDLEHGLAAAGAAARA